MEYTRLKGTDLTVPRLGMGCSQIASTFVPKVENEVIRAIHCALEHGVNFFDTADSYGQGDSERCLGKAIRGRRHETIISTKVGYRFNIGNGWMRAVKPIARSIVRRIPGLGSTVRRVRSTVAQQDFSPAYVRDSLHASLRRLQTDYVDLYLLHNPAPDVLINPKVIDTFNDLVKSGKVRHAGISCERAVDALQFVALKPTSVLQLKVHIADQEACDRVLPKIQSENVGIIAREVFGRGLIDSPPPKLNALFKRIGLSSRHIALGFALSQPGVDTALVGMSRVEHVLFNCAIFESPNLSPEYLAELNAWRKDISSTNAKGSSDPCH